MKITDLLEAIKADLQATDSLSDARDIDISPGRFNADEVTRRTFKAPALRVAFLGAPRTQPKPDATRRYEAAFAVFVLTDGKGRANEGIDLTEAVAERIELNRFSDGHGIGLPGNLRIDALYSGDLDDKGISLHSVSWTQAITIGTSEGIGAAGPSDTTMSESIELNTDIDITRMPEDV
ncbi:hypothetical protein [Cognatishimia sp. MH4019]|uniref:hypothetical protein n=1 Tax=Cognatishimia sp. MH4019 TaxID=2854030 RepID=UPI001CD65F3E|nr:hypothetical protein [Cognatishimia sp. MH4019]